ncbi:MAG: S8 family peptidase [Bacteroidia bacterium]
MKNVFNSNLNFKLIAALLLSTIVFFSSCKQANQEDELKMMNIGDESAPAAFIGNIPGTSYVPNQILLKFKKGIDDEIINAILVNNDAKVEEKILTEAMKEAGDIEGIFLIKVSGDIFQKIGNFKANPEVLYAEPNFIYTHSATSNDPYYTNGSLWGMYGNATSPTNQYGSQAGEAWAAGKTGSASVYIAIIDEGVMNSHDDLTANCWVNSNDPIDGTDNDGNGYKDDKWGWDFVDNNNSTFDGVGDDHATHVAGTIGAVGANSKGVVGVNWNIKMISCKFLGSSGGTTANAIKAVDYVTDLKTRQGLNIVATNNSWGGGGFSQGLKDAIDRADAKDILFIAAAGNSGTNNDATPSYPSNYTSSNVIAVAAITSSGTLASFSQYGANTVDIGAPGNGIYSSIPVSTKVKGKTTITSGYSSYSGTSMATPHVTGAAALYSSINSGSSASTIKSAILSAAISTSSLSGKCLTGGRLDVSGF